VLDRDGLDHIRDVFGLIEGALQIVVNLFPFDQLDGVALFLEELSQRLMVDRVAFFLDCFASTAYFMTSSPFLSRLTASASTAIIRCSTSMRRSTPGAATPSRKICVRRASPVHRIHDVIEIGRELVNVFAIERR